VAASVALDADGLLALVVPADAPVVPVDVVAAAVAPA
jgi:hypothetical protein